MKGKYSREAVLRLLADKSRVLADSGEARLPRRSDFSDEEVVAIKAFLGPWPRALEAAGLKPPRISPPRGREKRIRAKQRQAAARRETSSGSEESD